MLDRPRIPRLQLVALFLVVLLLGFLFAVQVRSQATVQRYLAGQDNVTLGLLITGLAQSNEQLIQARGDAAAQQQRLAAAVAGEGSGAGPLQEQLDRLRVFDGTTPVHGPGVEVQIAPRLSVVEVQDLTNLMRHFGAEAMSLNGHRIVAATILSEKNGQLAVDGMTVAAPYALLAIGDTAQLSDGATQAVASLRTRGAVNVLEQADLHIPATVPQRPVVYSDYR